MFTWSSFISHTMIYLIHCLVFTLALYISEEKIFQTYPRLVSTAFGLIFLNMTIRLQVSLLINKKYNPYKLPILFSWTILLFLQLPSHLGFSKFSGLEFYVYTFLVLFNGTCLIFLIHTLISEM